MKVLFINDAFTRGGATLALKELLLELKYNGVEPVVCTCNRDDFNTFLDDNGIDNIVDGHREVMEGVPKNRIKKVIKYVIRKPLYFISQYRALRIIEKNINLKEIDIIHSNSVRSDLGCLIHMKYQIPHVMHIREFSVEHFGCRIYRKNFYEYLNTHCEILLAVSEAVRAAWVSHGIDVSKIRTLYDGVDFRGFTVKESRINTTKDLRIVFVGGIYEGKGQHIAIEAINKLPQNVKEHVQLDIIGWKDQRYYKYLTRLIDDYELKEQISILGESGDIGNILSNYDIGLMCSKAEGFGRATVEYMYTGLCVIAADTGASPELIIHGVNGLLYDRNNEKDLANKISILYKNRELMNIYGHKAHEYTKERFTSLKNAREVINVYGSICKQKD